MPHLKLNARSVAGLKAPDPTGKQVLHWDTELKGFAVLCSGVSNTRTYIAQRDLPSGKTRRVTVGSLNEVSLDVARERAADMLDSLRRGIDPKIKSGIDVTLKGTLEDYLAARKNLRPASIRAYRFTIEKSLASWCELPLASITPEMVEARHRAIAVEVGKDGNTGNTGTTSANFAMRAFRILWNFAADRVPDLPPNPVRRLRRQWFTERRRERIVGVDDLPKFYQAVDDLPNKIARDFVLLLLFTGLRLGEARALRWEEIDLKNGIIHVPGERTKTGRKLDLPMSDFVKDLLIARRALGNAGWCFPAPGKSGHIRDLQHPLTLVANATGIRVSAHDFRRGFITIAESCDISPIALKALVNHSTGKDATSGYVIMTTDRLREAGQKVCDKLKGLCGITDLPGNVAKMKSRK